MILVDRLVRQQVPGVVYQVEMAISALGGPAAVLGGVLSGVGDLVPIGNDVDFGSRAQTAAC